DPRVAPRLRSLAGGVRGPERSIAGCYPRRALVLPIRHAEGGVSMRRSDWNRRQFLARAAAPSLALPVAWALRRSAQAGEVLEFTGLRGPFVDVHTHVGRTWNGDPLLTADTLVRWMDDHNVAKAVVLPLVSPESSSYLNLTEQALAAARRFPERLVPF